MMKKYDVMRMIYDDMRTIRDVDDKNRALSLKPLSTMLLAPIMGQQLANIVQLLQ